MPGDGLSSELGGLPVLLRPAVIIVACSVFILCKQIHNKNYYNKNDKQRKINLHILIIFQNNIFFI